MSTPSIVSDDNSKGVENDSDLDLASTTTTSETLKADEQPEDSDFNSDDVTTDKVRSGDENEERNIVETPVDSNPTDDTKKRKNVSLNEKSKGATSRRGSRGGDRRGGSRGGKRKKTDRDQFSRGYFHEDASDFHASLFSPMQGPPFVLPGVESNEEIKRDGNPPPTESYVSRDLMIQLATNINSGFFYVNNAFELLKQSQIELCHAKYTLERIYRNQHCDLGQEDLFPNDVASPIAEQHTVWPDRNSYPDHSTSEVNNDTRKEPPTQSPVGQTISPPAEHFQVQLDPFQFLDDLPNLNVQPVVPVLEFGLKAGRGRFIGRGRGGHRGGRGKRQKEEPISTYSSEHAHQSLNELILHSSLRNEVNNSPFAAIVLHDIQPVLDTPGRKIRANIYSAFKVEAAIDRKWKRLAKRKRGINPKPSPEKSEVAIDPRLAKEMQQNKSENGHNQDQTAVQVSKIQIARPNDEEIEQTCNRKLHPMIINNNSMISHSIQSEDDESGQHIPRWKQLRVDPEMMESIKRRIQTVKSCSDSSDYACPSLSSLQQKQSSKASTPPETEIKLPSIESIPGVVSSSKLVSSPSSSSSSSSSYLTFEANNSSSTKSWNTPPDEEMLELTPDKDNCGCTTSSEILLSSSCHDSGLGSDAVNDAKAEQTPSSEGTSWKKSSSTETKVVQTVVRLHSAKGVINDAFYNDSGTEHDKSPRNSEDDVNPSSSNSDDDELFIAVRTKLKKH